MEGWIDALSLCDKLEINILDKGMVKLVDCSPRIVPEGRTPEFRIVQCARVSYDKGIKTKIEDDALITRLIEEKHTSPVEHVQFTFMLEIPIFVAVHLLRHRTAKINQFSQRYSEMQDKVFLPSSNPKEYIRLQDNVNKQGSNISEHIDPKIIDAINDIEKYTMATLQKYHELINLGVAKEVARNYLPMGMYTKMYYTIDLNNLLKLLHLRMDKHSQHETQMCAKAMYDLIKPLVPKVIDIFDNFENGMFMSQNEINSFTSGNIDASIVTSVRKNKSYNEKVKKLCGNGLYLNEEEVQSIKSDKINENIIKNDTKYKSYINKMEKIFE